MESNCQGSNPDSTTQQPGVPQGQGLPLDNWDNAWHIFGTQEIYNEKCSWMLPGEDLVKRHKRLSLLFMQDLESPNQVPNFLHKLRGYSPETYIRHCRRPQVRTKCTYFPPMHPQILFSHPIAFQACFCRASPSFLTSPASAPPPLATEEGQGVGCRISRYTSRIVYISQKLSTKN